MQERFIYLNNIKKYKIIFVNEKIIIENLKKHNVLYLNKFCENFVKN